MFLKSMQMRRSSKTLWKMKMFGLVYNKIISPSRVLEFNPELWSHFLVFYQFLPKLVVFYKPWDAEMARVIGCLPSTCDSVIQLLTSFQPCPVCCGYVGIESAEKYRLSHSLKLKKKKLIKNVFYKNTNPRSHFYCTKIILLLISFSTNFPNNLLT